ncbi:ELMO domain-containing protein 3 [Phytophthora pseudosyringae]|uniref:ELMO domain-containing protein 3 n=1 Tax=Phytophthora pseudosyringae TaxID=221518 RepID=A0A8T1WL76_9STRA|nr:ELMO domain-containing protein 3 [Phytophthora pseudosyringae]
MASDGPSDVDVLNDLLHGVDGEGDSFEDAEAFFDTDLDHDGEGVGDMTTDNILSQLDAVTTLDEDEEPGENADEFHDSTSAPSSPQLSGADERRAVEEDASALEEEIEAVSQESALVEQPSPLSGEAVVQAVLDLATDADDEDAQATASAQEQVPSPQNAIREEEEVASGLSAEVDAQNEVGNSEVNETTLDAVVVSTSSIGQNEEVENPMEAPPPPPAHEADQEAPLDPAIVPPPAPATGPVIVGSMNPVEDDNDDSDDSQGEEDGGSTALPPPLQLNIPEDVDDDDDEDVLEVDAAVVSSLQIEEKQRLSKRAEQQPLAATKLDPEADNALLKALPSSKNADDTSAIDLSFGDQVRVARVSTLEPSSPFSDIHKMAGGPTNSSKLSADATFGISYQSMRKKNVEEPYADEDDGGYSLPSGPAFPDEREFENEMELTSDVSFSVATTGASPRMAGAGNADDDEFSFDVKPEAGSSVLSEDVLKARRESLEARKRKQEQELLDELKRATDEEKKLIERNKAVESVPSEPATVKGSEAAVDADVLSLTELHSIYKRGLGDQEVLMDEEDETQAKTKTEAPEVGRSMSVMGRIFSQAQGATETIAEEADGDDSEGEENEGNKGDFNHVSAANDNTEDAQPVTEKSDADDSAEWREIKLVQHRQSQENSGSGVTAGNSPEAASVSLMSYAEAAGYYAETPDVLQHRDIIVSEDFPRASCLTCLSRPRLTFAGAIEERDRVFCIAATSFDAHNDVVVGILQTIYKKITQKNRDVLLMGRHWEDIGFQGSDPSTDLRGCGVLSLLQILYLVETFPDLAHRFHALSQHPTRHFPFACVLINITLQCVVALRSGALYPECNKHASVLSGMNRLHVALASQLHDAIQSRSDEIPIIMKGILDRGRSNPSKVIDEAFDGNSLRPPRPAPATGPSKSKASERKESANNNLEFTEIGLHSVDDEE